MASTTGLVSLKGAQGSFKEDVESLGDTMLDSSSVGQLMTSSTSMAKIFVGKEKKMWYVHEAIICAKSDYFSKALKGGFMEGRQKEVYLEDLDADAFSLFVDWVYGNDKFFQYRKGAEEDTRSSAVRSDDAEKEAFLYVKFYHLAHYLGVEALENLTMDAIVAHYYCRERRLCLQPEIVAYIYEWCPSESPIHAFLITVTAHEVLDFSIFGGGSYREAVLLCPQFGVDVLRKINGLGGSRIPYPRHLPSCNWHTHNRTKKCN